MRPEVRLRRCRVLVELLGERPLRRLRRDLLWTRIIGTARTRGGFYFINDKLSAQQAFEWGMVNRVLPAAELADHTMAVARQMLRTPASLWALLKDNLNRAEDDADRRRLLFANESANMVKAMDDIAERMSRKAAQPDTRRRA